MNVLQVRVTNEMKEKLIKDAKREGVSLSNYVQALLHNETGYEVIYFKNEDDINLTEFIKKQNDKVGKA